LSQKGNNLEIKYRWAATIKSFNMPLLVGKQMAYKLIHPTTNWKSATFKNMTKKDFKIATELFLIDVLD
jgi:hypothetical protein